MITTYKPFWDGIIASAKNSPYPWWYTLLWPLYFRFPSTVKWSSAVKRNHADVLAEPSEDDISLLLAGDIMVLNGDAVPILSPELLNLINTTDVFLANCEAPIGDHVPDPSKRYSFLFHMPRNVLTGIFDQTSISYDRIVLTNANNHSGDAGQTAYSRSFDILQELGITSTGLNKNKAITTKTINGFNIGFCGWTEWLNCQIFDEFHAPTSHSDIAQMALPEIKSTQGIDYLIGMPHWEYEFQHFPKNKTISQGKKLIRQGFDLILGSHPHVLQPLDIINNKLCIYALGNFCGLGVSWPVKIIPLVSLKVGPNSNGKTVVKSYEYHFFYQYHTKDEIVIKPLIDIEASMFERAKKRIDKILVWPV